MTASNSLQNESPPSYQPVKYPKTPHLPFSPGINPDDTTLHSLSNILNTPILISEKLDGGNFQYFNGEIYARTVSKLASHESFSAVKQNFAGMKYVVPERYAVFGENLQGVHSIEYDTLSSFHYVFAILDHKHKKFLSWSKVCKLCGEWGLEVVPVLHVGEFRTEKELHEWMLNRMGEGSTFGKQIEGFVLRRLEGFPYEHFDRNVCKFVRKGHIQTSADWSRKWKQAKIVR